MRLVDALRAFNRREGQILYEWAYGERTLGHRFITEVSTHLARRGSGGSAIPSNAYVAVDYPFDWLVGALAVVHGGVGDLEDGIGEPFDDLVEGSRLDIDLLIAFPNGDGEHLILGDVKGFTAWSHSQLERKARRAAEIFGEDGRRWPGVVAHWLLIASSGTAPNIDTEGWPSWIGDHLDPLQLRIPKVERLRLQRFNPDSGEPDGGSKQRRVVSDWPWDQDPRSTLLS